MSDLRAQIDEECRLLAERRSAARSLSSFAYVMHGNVRRPTEPMIVSRDPCFKCGARGDLGCTHRPAAAPEPLECEIIHRPTHHHKINRGSAQ